MCVVEQIIRWLILGVAYALINLYSSAVNAGTIRSVPACLAGFCLDTETLPAEKAIRARFGGVAQPVQQKAIAYCYQFAGHGKKIGYGYFILKKHFGTGWRLVTIRLSNEPLCTNAHIVQLQAVLSTKEGISLDAKEIEVFSAYGRPSYVLLPPPTEVVNDFFGDSSKTTINVIDQYVSDDDKNTATALFYISSNRVAGIEISVDE